MEKLHSETAQAAGVICTCGCGRATLPAKALFAAYTDQGIALLMQRGVLTLTRNLSSEEARSIGEQLIAAARTVENAAAQAAADALAKIGGAQ